MAFIKCTVPIHATVVQRASSNKRLVPAGCLSIRNRYEFFQCDDETAVSVNRMQGIFFFRSILLWG